MTANWIMSIEDVGAVSIIGAAFIFTQGNQPRPDGGGSGPRREVRETQAKSTHLCYKLPCSTSAKTRHL